MNDETYEALKRVVKKTKNLLNTKYGHRKRLSPSEVWEKATLIRDITQVESWIDKTAKEHNN